MEIEKTQKKKTCQQVDFSVQTDHRVKIKENDKRIDIYFDFTRERKKLCNMKVIAVMVVAYEMVPQHQ